MGTVWKKSVSGEYFYEGTDSATGEMKWMGSAADLLFGSNSELRDISEVYACNDAGEKYVRYFIAAWTKVMELDCFDLHR